MGGFFDFEKMKRALDAEYPQGATRDDVDAFCLKCGIFGSAKKEFFMYLSSCGYGHMLFRSISLTPFLDGK